MGFLDFLKKRKKVLRKILKEPPKCFLKLFWALDMIDEYGDIGGSLHRVPVAVFENLKLDGFYVERRYRRGVEFWLTARYKTVELYSKNFKLEETPCWLKEKMKNDDRIRRTLREEGIIERVYLPE